MNSKVACNRPKTSPVAVANTQAKEAGRLTGLGSRATEYVRTAEMLVEIANRPCDGGAFYILAFLLDSGYGPGEMRELLPILQATPGAISGRTLA